MIKIGDSTSRDLVKISLAHLAGVKPFVIKGIRKNIAAKQQDFLLTHLDTILAGKPHELIAIHRLYQKFCKTAITPLNKGVAKAFSYPNFLARKSYNAYNLAEQLQVNVCPYCNRQYTFTVRNTATNITRPVFDHFFSQHFYPLLSLSFYNLIPSCSVCNSTLKGTKLFSIKENIHPYLHGFEDNCLFDYLPYTADGAIGVTDEISVLQNINGRCTNAKRIITNHDIFKLKDIYQHHRDIVREIIHKHHVSGGKYLQMLVNTFPGMGATTEELYQLAFGNFYDATRLEKRPLSKLTKDIFEQLKFEVI